MAKYDLQLLDCTLRDGGYVNDWQWGFRRARDIIHALVRSGVDVVEVGFLRNVDDYNPDVTVCNRIEELNKLLPANRRETMFSAMAMRSNYDIKKLSPYKGEGIEMIRVTAHDYDIKDGMDFARAVKEKGYRLSINPINIMGYSDERILWILKQVNDIHPYQFSIVDTFGSMKRRDLDRIVSLVDNNLDKDIRVSLHLHENMSLSCSLAQNFIDKHLNRPVAVDGSLMGMGRIPGNLPVELMADYLNDYTDKNYDIDFLMDAIQDYIAPLKGESEWGYTPAFFLSAKFNLHRNYAEHYLRKGDLTNRDINHILARFDSDKTTVFDAGYADMLYEDYKNNQIDDTFDRKELERELNGKNILLIAPGAAIKEFKEDILDYISSNDVVVIGVNFVPEVFSPDYVFFSNSKRRNSNESIDGGENNVNSLYMTIVTSNMEKDGADFYINYNSLSGAFEHGCNSLIMLLKLLKSVKAGNVALAGADGYSTEKQNYYSSNIRNYTEHGNRFNIAVAESINKLDMNISFITPSEYNKL